MEIKREEIIILNNLLGGKKIGKLSKEGAFVIVDNKIALSKVVKEIEEAQKIASEETKPEALKAEGAEETKDLKEAWNKAYGEYMTTHLGETVEVELKKLNREDYMALVQENDVTVAEAEFLMLIRHD
jgi:hypothetical protein